MSASVRVHSERSLVWLFAAVQLTLLLDFMIMLPLGPSMMAELALTPATFGGLVSSYTLASAAAGLSGALWLHRVERRTLLFALYTAFACATLGCALLESVLGLLAARVVAGASAGLSWATLMALVVELVPVERRGRAMGTVMTSYAVSAVLGVPLGLGVASRLGWRMPFVAIAAASLALLVLLLKTLPPGQRMPAMPERAADVERPSQALRMLLSRELSLGWLLTFLVVFAGFLLIPYLSTFMVQNLSVAPLELSWVYLSGGAATFFTMRAVGSLVDRHGPAPVLACLLLATAPAHLLFTQLSEASLSRVAVCFVLFMTLTSGRIVPTLALVTARVPRDLHGRFLAVNTAVSDLASGLAAWLSGSLLTSARDGALVGFERLGFMAVTTSGCALLCLWLSQRRRTGNPALASPTEA